MEQDNPKKVLVIDDDPDVHRLMKWMLERHGFHVSTAADSQSGLNSVKTNPPQVILLDYQLKECDGLSLLEPLRNIAPSVPVILMTAYSSVELVMESMQAGVHDFLPKPIEEARLVAALMKAIEHHRLLSEVAELQTGAVEHASFEGIIGQSPQMQTIFRIIENVAPTEVSVMITGESGTGKELIARAVHSRSRHSRGPWVPLNMAAIPKELVESTLFGHERGAFTGAEKRRIGACEEANGGTLFLDEITEMPAELQAKLLRFIQERRFRRLGGHVDMEAEVRLISATNRDPLESVKQGTLREDLFYRLNVVPIKLPPLRDRVSDVPLIAMHQLAVYNEKYRKRFNDISPRAIQALMRFPWPGNVRQLCHALERAVVLNDGSTLTVDMLPPEITDTTISTHDAAKLAGAPPGTPGSSIPGNSHGTSAAGSGFGGFPTAGHPGEGGHAGMLSGGDPFAGNHYPSHLTGDPGAAPPVIPSGRSFVPHMPASSHSSPGGADTGANAPGSLPGVLPGGAKVLNGLVVPTCAEDIVPMEEIEKQAIANALAVFDGSAGRAAKSLGISEATIYRKIKAYGLK